MRTAPAAPLGAGCGTWLDRCHAYPNKEGGMNIEFLSTVAVITRDLPASRKVYLDALGGGEYLHSEQVAGCKSFGIWPLSQAAEACFGTPKWPAKRPVPQISIEFDVPNADAVGPGRASSSKLATSCCTQRARSRGVRRWPGCSLRRARSSGFRTSLCSTTKTRLTGNATRSMDATSISSPPARVSDCAESAARQAGSPSPQAPELNEALDSALWGFVVVISEGLRGRPTAWLADKA